MQQATKSKKVNVKQLIADLKAMKQAVNANVTVEGFAYSKGCMDTLNLVTKMLEAA